MIKKQYHRYILSVARQPDPYKEDYYMHNIGTIISYHPSRWTDGADIATEIKLKTDGEDKRLDKSYITYNLTREETEQLIEILQHALGLTDD